MDLILEDRNQPDQTPQIGSLIFTPPITEDYWHYRVRVGDAQAVVGFPKFTTIGSGFAVEDDWNTNLPYTQSAEDIYEHIAHNKGDDSIPAERCIAAIRLIQEAAQRHRSRLNHRTTTNTHTLRPASKGRLASTR